MEGPWIVKTAGTSLPTHPPPISIHATVVFFAQPTQPTHPIQSARLQPSWAPRFSTRIILWPMHSRLRSTFLPPKPLNTSSVRRRRELFLFTPSPPPPSKTPTHRPIYPSTGLNHSPAHPGMVKSFTQVVSVDLAFVLQVTHPPTRSCSSLQPKPLTHPPFPDTPGERETKSRTQSPTHPPTHPPFPPYTGRE